MEYIQYCLYLSLAYYSIVILYLRYSLFNIPNKKNSNKDNISIIIAVKDGSKSLDRLLKSLTQQTFQGTIEFIIVDDNSTDNSIEIIKHYIKKDKRITFTQSNYGNKNLTHKKRALDAGIKIATGNILLFSDVDCFLPNSWVDDMILNFNNDIDYIVGYSEVPHSSNFVTLFQKIDFFMLMNAAHASINLNWYWASSGQNQAYKKSVFKKNNGFNQIANCLQGDDTLFFQLSKKINKNMKAVFAFNESNKVFCRKEKNIITFLKQRIRWSGDAIKTWRLNKYFFLMSVCTFFTNFILFFNLFLLIFQKISLNQFIIPLIFKFITEYCFALKGMKIHNDRYSIIQFLFWFLFQPIYIIIIGIGSLFQNHIAWKGEKIK